MLKNYIKDGFKFSNFIGYIFYTLCFSLFISTLLLNNCYTNCWIKVAYSLLLSIVTLLVTFNILFIHKRKLKTWVYVLISIISLLGYYGLLFAFDLISYHVLEIILFAGLFILSTCWFMYNLLYTLKDKKDEYYIAPSYLSITFGFICLGLVGSICMNLSKPNINDILIRNNLCTVLDKEYDKLNKEFKDITYVDYHDETLYVGASNISDNQLLLMTLNIKNQPDLTSALLTLDAMDDFNNRSFVTTLKTERSGIGVGISNFEDFQDIEVVKYSNYKDIDSNDLVVGIAKYQDLDSFGYFSFVKSYGDSNLLRYLILDTTSLSIINF